LRESLAYGSFISATDPVAIISAFKDYNTDANFFQIVLGESILNDAVSIVFYETCLKYGPSSFAEKIFEAFLSFLLNIFGSTILGFSIGFLTAIFLKLISSKVKQIERIEISLMVILPWVSYLTAQVIIYYNLFIHLQ
jgi:NhaP-type Na+/H+ or K+/H+ antiporter